MDSRYEAARNYIKKSWPFSIKITYFLLNFFIAWSLTLIIKTPELSPSAVHTLFILIFALALWVSEAIPPFAVGILIISYLVVTMGSIYFNPEPEDVGKYVNTWSSPVIWLLLGGFFIAAAMEKTGLDLQLLRFALSLASEKPSRILLTFMATAMISSMIMSNTATTAMMIACITPFLENLDPDDPFGKSLLLGIPAAASLGGMGTIIGSPPNAIAVGALANIGIKVDFLTWMLYGFPLAVVTTLGFWYLLSRKLPAKQERINRENIYKKIPQKRSSNKNRMVVIITLILTVGLWLTGPLHGIPVAAVSAIPIMFLTVSGILKGKHMRALPWDTLMLVAGGLALGVAITESGLANYFISMFRVEDTPMILIVIVFAYITMAFSNIMSNTAGYHNSCSNCLNSIGRKRIRGCNYHWLISFHRALFAG